MVGSGLLLTGGNQALPSAVQRDNWLGDLFNAYGYPLDQAGEKITADLGYSVDDGVALRNTYYSLKFLKSVRLIDDFRVNDRLPAPRRSQKSDPGHLSTLP